MRNTKIIFIQIAPIAILVIVLGVFALFIKASPNANSFWISVLATIFVTVLSAIATLSVVVLRNLPDRLKMYNLLEHTVDNVMLIFTSNIYVPTRRSYTYNGPLRFGGYVIALEEYFAAISLSNFLELDILASYPSSLRKVISKILPKAKPIKPLLRVAPLSEYELKKVAGEYGLKENISIISLGSPGSNWLTAYVSEYHPGWFKFGTDCDYIKTARGTGNEIYSLNDYKDVGLIQRVTLPNEKMTVIVLAGLSELSTRMCATYFVNKWRELSKNESDFGICLVVPLDNPEAYDHPTVVSAYPRRS